MSGLDIIAVPGHPGMFARRVAVQAWQSAGSPRVNSAGRLYALQKYFWDGWRKRLPGFNPADNPDDETQALAHCRFVAFDIDPTADRIKRLTAAGMVRPYSYEPWHWELPNVRSYSIVRSIPATAGDNITPIIEEEEDDDMAKPVIITNSKNIGIIIDWQAGTWRGIYGSETANHEKNGAIVTKAASDGEFDSIKASLRELKPNAPQATVAGVTFPSGFTGQFTA